MNVEKLNSIAKLDELGFEGVDASLEESLFEYGMIWKSVGDEFLFIYKISDNRFDRQTMKIPSDIKKEFDWVNWSDFLNFIGDTFDQWRQIGFGRMISDLVLYYGRENIFGSCYWEGFVISD